MNKELLREKSYRIRANILLAAKNAGNKGAHIAPSLSLVEIMSVLFNEVMDPERDEIILSKGHGGLCYYAAMESAGIITLEQFETFEQNGGEFPGQPTKTDNNHIAYASGSLGLGLSYGVGRALASKLNSNKKRVFVVIGDGELNEGSNWEAVMFASQLGIKNITAIVDRNNMQSDGNSEEIIKMDLHNLWKAHGWNVTECNGHDEQELCTALRCDDGPTVILANTIKGKGVSFMENNPEWHHAVLSEKQYTEAMIEVDAYYGK